MKKIDTSKSLIFSREYEDIKNSLEYLNQYGYFSNGEDFSEYEEAELNIVNFANFVSRPYILARNGFRYSFSYFIPKSKVVFIEEETKKKTLRQFKSTEEFFNVTGFKIGDIVQIKKFGNYNYDEKSIFSGVRVYIDEEFHRNVAIFGASTHSFDDLFKRFKYYKNSEWLRFGVEE